MRWFRRLLKWLRERPAPDVEVCSIDGHIWRSLGSVTFGRQCSSCGALEFDRGAPDGVEAYVRLFVEEGMIAPPKDSVDTRRCCSCGRALVPFSPGLMQFEGCIFCGNPFGECPCNFKCVERAMYITGLYGDMAICDCEAGCRCEAVKMGCGLKHRRI
jgi:hypothetical protein